MEKIGRYRLYCQSYGVLTKFKFQYNPLHIKIKFGYNDLDEAIKNMEFLIAQTKIGPLWYLMDKQYCLVDYEHGHIVAIVANQQVLKLP